MNYRNGGDGPQIIPISLEMEEDVEEEEVDSLMRETTMDDGDGLVIPKSRGKRFSDILTRRNNNNVKRSRSSDNESAFTGRIILGLLRTNIGNAATIRAFGLLVAMALITFLLSDFWQRDVHHIHTEHQSEKSPHHGPSLGGASNPGHYNNNNNNDSGPGHQQHDDAIDIFDDDGYKKHFVYTKATYNDDSVLDGLILPKSNVGSTVISRSHANIKNSNGHYLHDPLRSPYASPLYLANVQNVTRPQLLQRDFELRMNHTVSVYGRWTTPTLPPSMSTHLENTTILQTPHKDYPTFPSNAWQANREYLTAFLKQAHDLVERVKEGIYEEYGYGILSSNTTTSSNKERESRTKARLSEFQVIVGDDFVITEDDDATAVDEVTEARIPGVAYLNKAAWSGLVRKLLHGMMTNDDFYVVSAGQVETYVANNFFQSSVMQFNHIMEPVFDKLGMKLISRGADIYGEADIFLYLGEPEDEGMMDFLHRQSILSGARVPILLSPMIGPLREKTDNGAWVGNLQPGASFCQATYVDPGTSKLLVPSVTACRYVVCADDIADRCDKHNSVCWIDRADQSREMAEQDADVGRTGEYFPNYNVQKLEGRKLAMLVLEALEEAISRWSGEVKKGNLPLANDAWHVGKVYDEVRERVREAKKTQCEEFMRGLDSRICHIEMHAFTEWTPRVHPHVSRLKHITKTSIPIVDNHGKMKEIYSGVDLLPIKWMVDPKAVDVHMIAIAADTVKMKEESDLNADAALSGMDFIADDDRNRLFNDDDGKWATKMVDADDEKFFSNVDDDIRRGRRRPQRQLFTDDFSTSNTWTLYNAPKGFCDGSAQARCNRVSTNTCLLSGYNFYKAGIMGHGHSGKLKLTIPNVKEGIILARFEWRMDDGPRVRTLPHDVEISFTVDSTTTKHSRQSFAAAVVGLSDDLFIHPLLLDKEMLESKTDKARDVEVEIEAVSHIQGDKRLIMLSHIYYA